MTKILLVIFTSVSLSLCNITSCLASGYQNLKFANDLMFRGEYYRAVTEYYRFNSYNPNDKRKLSNHFKIAQCLELSGRHKEAISEYTEIANTFTNARIPAFENIARIQSKTGEYIHSNETIRNLEILTGANQDELKLIKAKNYIHLGNYPEAKEIFINISNNKGKLSTTATSYLEIMHEQLPLKYKSKPLGASIGAFLPGAGYAYASKPLTAVSASVVIGGLSYSSYECFNKGIYGVGSILAVVASAFYVGSIYGTVQSIEKETNEKRNAFTGVFNF